MTERAISQSETRRRIVEAAVDLHGSVGPRAASISAIAERAGVTRLTFYRHFPTEADIFAACSAHYASLHPAPALTLWAWAQGLERTRIALSAFCDYYRTTHEMWSNVYADARSTPAVNVPLGEFKEYLEVIAADLAASFGRNRPRLLMPTLRHALAFETWGQLEAQNLDDKTKQTLMLAWIEGVRTNR